MLLILASSYYFYAAWNPAYLLLVILTTAFFFYLAIIIANTKDIKRRRWMLFLSISSNLLILFSSNIIIFLFRDRDIIEHGRCWLSSPNLGIVLPIAISFYTFQIIGYLIDVYKNSVKPETNYYVFSLYVVFPQLVAGPIEDFSVRLNYVHFKVRVRNFDRERTSAGLRLVYLVFSKNWLSLII